MFGLYNTITLGIKGTGMTGFAALSDAQRWALAFYVSTLAAKRRRARARGRALEGGTGAGELGDLRALVMATPREVTAPAGPRRRGGARLPARASRARSGPAARRRST